MLHRFSLVLWGWSARALAHIGIIKRLEECHVVPSLVVGTSMGAIIAALYACGYSSREMQDAAKGIRFFSLLDPDILHGGIKWNKIVSFLKKYFDEKTFRDVEFPLKIIAVDIHTGAKVVFESGKIIDALRASISIPWIFTPYRYKGMTLVDGGIVANLPIEEALPWEKVIAVSVQLDVEKQNKRKTWNEGFIKRPFIQTYLVLRKAVSIMIKQNERFSLASREDVCFLRLGREDIDYYDFQKCDRLIHAWYLLGSEIRSYLEG